MTTAVRSAIAVVSTVWAAPPAAGPWASALVVVLSLSAVLVLAIGLLVAKRSRALRRRQRLILTPATAGTRRSPVLSSRVAPGALGAVLSGPRWRAVSLALVAGAAVGFLAGGLVAAIALGAYSVVAVVYVRGRRVAAARRAARSALLDRLTGLAADLRAGVPIQAAAKDYAPADEAGAASGPLSDTRSGVANDSASADEAGVASGPLSDNSSRAAKDSAPADEADRLAGLVRAAVTLAERTGAPLADLIDRIEADARAGDRARAAAIAQAAGAQATALLLAALPVGGLGLGYAIGADPLAILLGTPLGAVCALCAVALQILGLVWAQRLQPRLP